MTNELVIEVRPGAGGEESEHWALQVLEMEANWALKNDLHIRAFVNRDSSDPSRLHVEGTNAGAVFASEHGVHRLTRNSPFDPAHRRHTSFAAVKVGPADELDEVVRTYVLDPYRLVKDQISGRETNDVESVLLGDLTAVR